MGMNYYAHVDTCSACGRAEIYHIGKSSYGWTFGFRGYKGYPFDKIKIESYKDWIIFLDKNNVNIVNEEGEHISKSQFKELVKTKMSEKNNHTLYVQETNILKSCYENRLDEEGHSFTFGEFC